MENIMSLLIKCMALGPSDHSPVTEHSCVKEQLLKHLI